MKSSILILALLFAPFLALTQSFQASVSSDSILLGNYIELSFSAQDLDGTFERPDISQHVIISGPNTSQSIQIINGASSSNRSWSYMIDPTETGEIVIPPAYLVTDDKSYETDPIYINIYPNPEGIIEPPKRQSGFSLFDQFEMPSYKKQIPKKDKTKKKSKRKLKRL